MNKIGMPQQDNVMHTNRNDEVTPGNYEKSDITQLDSLKGLKLGIDVLPSSEKNKDMQKALGTVKPEQKKAEESVMPLLKNLDGLKDVSETQLQSISGIKELDLKSLEDSLKALNPPIIPPSIGTLKQIKISIDNLKGKSSASIQTFEELKDEVAKIDGADTVKILKKLKKIQNIYKREIKKNGSESMDKDWGTFSKCFTIIKEELIWIEQHSRDLEKKVCNATDTQDPALQAFVLMMQIHKLSRRPNAIPGSPGNSITSLKCFENVGKVEAIILPASNDSLASF